MMNHIAKAFNPGTYTAAYARVIANTNKEIRAGSIKPLFKLMATVGTLGYTMEWYAKERHHVAHKRAILEAAEKAGGHH